MPGPRSDTVIAMLPGSSAEETIIVNTHTDGPNATEENGGVGIVALAKYFSKIAKSERKRTLVFPLTTGHFASPWVPSIRGFITKYPDVIKKTVAAVTVEHLGCKEWMDDAQYRYRDGYYGDNYRYGNSYGDTQRQYYGERRGQRDPSSLDGRRTGQPRTCGFDFFQYDNRGVPSGPYCN